MSALTTIPTLEDIKALQQVMLRMPQAELKTTHWWADGMYLREVWRPAGCVIVGKVHKREHFYILLSGEITVTGDGIAPQRYQAPMIFVSPPGTKRAVYAHVDSVCITVHATESRDLDEIEKELIEPDTEALFDARNELKRLEVGKP